MGVRSGSTELTCGREAPAPDAPPPPSSVAALRREAPLSRTGPFCVAVNASLFAGLSDWRLVWKWPAKKCWFPGLAHGGAGPTPCTGISLWDLGIRPPSPPTPERASWLQLADVSAPGRKKNNGWSSSWAVGSCLGSPALRGWCSPWGRRGRYRGALPVEGLNCPLRQIRDPSYTSPQRGTSTDPARVDVGLSRRGLILPRL